VSEATFDTPRRLPVTSIAVAVSAALLIASAVVALGVGPIAIAPLRVAEILTAHFLAAGEERSREAIVILDVRLPRVLLGIIVGATTAVAGAVMQGLFRNPLADPGIVGVSSGAAFAAALWFVLGAAVVPSLPPIVAALGLPLSAFVGSLLVSAVLYLLSRTGGRTSSITLILAGVALAAFTSAGIGILIFIASDQQLREFTFWMLGSLGGATVTKVLLVLPFAAILLLAGPMLARGLDAMALGEAEAFHLGIDVESLKRVAIAAVAAAVGAAVAVSGVIAFFGLALPHLVRLAIGPAHRPLLIVSALFGGAMMVAADMIARTIAAPVDVPLGVITSGVGAPFMLWLLLARRRELVA
jgi:iron complex transport system permease protein